MKLKPEIQDHLYKFEIGEGFKPIFIKASTKEDKTVFTLGRGTNENGNISNSVVMCITALKALEEAIGRIIAEYDT